MTDGPAFFRAIEAQPADDTPRLVYADWLDENAETDADRARADLIRVQCELAREPDPQRRFELESREWHLLLSDHASTWSMTWPLKLLTPIYRRGFLDPVALPAADFPPHAGQLAERMPLFHLRLIRARDAMRAVAACPQLALVRRLTLAGAWVQNAEMTALAVSPHLGELQQLDLGENQIGIRGATDLATTHAPALRELRLARNPIRDDGLLAVAQADWPALEHLDASECGLRTVGVSAFALASLTHRLVSLRLARNQEVLTNAWLRLAAVPFTRLEVLDLSSWLVTNEVAEALAANPALVNLRELHLDTTTITDRGARAILESPYLRGLMRLRLPEANLDAALRERLRAAYGAGFNPR